MTIYEQGGERCWHSRAVAMAGSIFAIPHFTAVGFGVAR